MLLLDTHFVLWLALEPEKVSAKFISALSEARKHGPLSISATTLWEIAWLDAKGRLALDPPVSVFLRNVERVYNVLPMTADIAIRASQFSSAYPNDPADRQIGATVIVHGLKLITQDDKILKSKEVPCLA